MAWGSITVAGFVLRETTAADVDGSTVRIAGQESHPPSTRAQVAATLHNIPQLFGSTVPVTFSDKQELDGFYMVSAASCHPVVKQGGVFQTADWSMTLERSGSERDVEVESRIPTVARSTTVSSPPAAVFWHAPAVGTSSYWTGATVPGQSILRTSADGDVPVFLSIPASVAPRWTVSAANFMKGGAKLLFDGVRRFGTLTPPLSVWQVDNGLVRLLSGPSGSFAVSCWSGGAWSSLKGYAVTVDGVALTGTPEFTVLKNEPGRVVVRLSYPTLPGRVEVDLGLRRGSRFVTGVIKRHSAATLGVSRTAAEAATAVTGGLKATAVDADGNRFALGSAASVTTTTGTASIAKAAVLQLDFFAGHEVGASPAAGDSFTELWQQYRHGAAEDARMVKR